MGVSKESISKFLIGNRFHVKLRILSPYSNSYVKLISYQKFAGGFKSFTCVEISYWNTNVCKFEPSQKDESRAHSADSSKAYSKLRAFNGS